MAKLKSGTRVYGSAIVDSSLTVGGNIILTSGQGIDFSATANSTGTVASEILSDYEEGTFTPTIVGSTTAGVGTYSVQTGSYTKVGNRVYFNAYLTWTAHTGTGNMRVSNLPFTNGLTDASTSAISVFINNMALTANNTVSAYTSPGNTYINIVQYPVGGGASAFVTIDVDATILVSGHYRI